MHRSIDPSIHPPFSSYTPHHGTGGTLTHTPRGKAKGEGQGGRDGQTDGRTQEPTNWDTHTSAHQRTRAATHTLNVSTHTKQARHNTHKPGHTHTKEARHTLRSPHTQRTQTATQHITPNNTTQHINMCAWVMTSTPARQHRSNIHLWGCIPGYRSTSNTSTTPHRNTETPKHRNTETPKHRHTLTPSHRKHATRKIQNLKTKYGAPQHRQISHRTSHIAHRTSHMSGVDVECRCRVQTSGADVECKYQVYISSADIEYRH